MASLWRASRRRAGAGIHQKQQLQRRGISKWFRFADADIQKRSGATNLVRQRRIPQHRHDQVECRKSFKEQEMARKRLSSLGFDDGRGASIEDMRWVGDGEPTVALLWDLHNKPEGMEPYAAARRVTEIAGVFGKVVDKTAYASRRMLCFLPVWNREYKKVRPLSIVDGELVSEQWSCGLCGFQGMNHDHLIRHFRLKHENERNQKIYEMYSTPLAEKWERFRLRKMLVHKEERYKAEAKRILTPRVLLPDGLPAALVKADFFVRQMADKPPKAPDMAAWTHICQVVNLGVGCVCFVCDTSNYTGVMDYARRMNTHTVLIGVGNRQQIKQMVNLSFSWEEVVTGKAMAMAEQAAATWAAKENEPGRRKPEHRGRPYAVVEDDLFFEYYEDLYPSSDSDYVSSDSEEESD